MERTVRAPIHPCLLELYIPSHHLHDIESIFYFFYGRKRHRQVPRTSWERRGKECRRRRGSRKEFQQLPRPRETRSTTRPFPKVSRARAQLQEWKKRQAKFPGSQWELPNREAISGKIPSSLPGLATTETRHKENQRPIPRANTKQQRSRGSFFHNNCSC